jgi:UDP-perosamine 4-acetyltransferase
MKLLGLGAGGHGRVVLELLQQAGHTMVGWLDADPALHGTCVAGLPVIGGDDRLASLVAGGVQGVFIGVGSVSSLGPRRRLFHLAMSHGVEVVPLVHPTAWIARSATIGRGATILAGAIVNTDASLGDNVLVNTRAVVEHDARIGCHVHIASGATLTGGVAVGDEVHIGAGATVLQGRRIGARAIVGAGAVVTHDVDEGETVVGVPARRHVPAGSR